MNTNKKKLYSALILYILSMAILLVSRLFDFYEIWAFAATSVGMIIFSLICKAPKLEKREKDLGYNGKTLYSTLIFSSWLLLAIPLILIGDYLASLSGLGYDIGFLGGGVANPVLWITLLVSALAYELFFRGIIYHCFSNIFNKKNAMLITSLSFAIYFLDIRLIAALFLLNISQSVIGVISNKYRYLFSIIAPSMILIVLCVISGENSGALYFGISNIFGMLMIFLSISVGICYVLYKKYNEKKATYIEIMVMVIALMLLLLIGSLIITL